MIKSSRYIIKRVIIGALIGIALMFAKMYLPHAEVISINAFASGQYLKPGVNIGTYGDYINMRVDFLGYAEGITDLSQPMYVSLAVCRTWAGGGIDGNSQYNNAQSYGVQNTNIKCPFANSQYGLTGFVSIYTYKLYGGGSYNLTEFKVYTALNTSGTYYTDMQLIDLSVSPNQFKSSNDYAYLGEIVNTNNMANGISSLVDKMTQMISQLQTNQTTTNTWLENVRNAIKNMDNTMKDDSVDDSFSNSKIGEIAGKQYNNASISDIVLLPVTLLNSAVDGLSSNSCTPYNLGNLFDTALVLPCVSSSDFSSWLPAVYVVIDALMSFGVIIGIRKLVLKIYNTIIFLKEGGGTID